MVDRVQNQPLMFRIGGQVRLLEQRCRHGQSGLSITGALRFFAGVCEIVAQTNQPLRRDGRRRGIDRLKVVVRIGAFGQIVAEAMDIRRPGVPGRDAVHAAVLEIKIGGGTGRLEHHRGQFSSATKRLERRVLQRHEKLELLRISAKRPGQTTRPCTERRVTLLRIRAAVTTVVQVKNTLVRRAPTNVVMIPAFTVVNAVIRRRLGMLDEPLE